MPTITIENVDYETENLSDEAKAQLQAIQSVDRRLADLQQEVAILQTARNAYVLALKNHLDAQS